MITLIHCGITAGLWLFLYWSFTKDRSRYRNCFILFFALLSTAMTITFLAGPYQNQVISFLFLATTIALLLVPLFLIHNGILMIIREGFRLPNLLSLGLGILIGVGEIATFFAVLGSSFIGYENTADPNYLLLNKFSIFVSVSVIYFSLSFLIFMIYSLFLQIIPRKKDFDFLIIHGAGLLQGYKLSKLLKDRVDKAIEVYQKDPTPPIIIPSGGKGPDEAISEAEAIARYLKEKGIPENKIILEDKSISTFENLRNSKAIIDAAEGNKYTALVTSNYHVYRALRYCRRIGMDCTGIGSHVAFYYWPSALIREFIAVHAEKKHLVYLIGGWILTLAVVMIPLFLQ
ncbi:MAG: YdcF family protein [Solobacterium sp.]|nr:YdcF family protein [Solobacterium sp.]